MNGIQNVAVEVAVSIMASARQQQLMEAGFPDHTTSLLAEVESRWRKSLLWQGEPIAAILTHLRWDANPESWLDWELILEQPPSPDGLLVPKATGHAKPPVW